MALGDSDGEVAFAYGGKEAVASFYATDDPEQAADLLRNIIDHGSKRSAPFEVRRLARTLHYWFEPIVACTRPRFARGMPSHEEIERAVG